MSESNWTIWKYTIPVTDSQHLKIEGGTLVEILHAASHPGEPGAQSQIDIWAVIDVHPLSVEFVPIEIRETGHSLREERFSHYNEKYPLDPCAKNSHIATVIDGQFVWHVFRGGVFD